jgi:tRNA A37 methylthiotransferase MiaB
LPDSIAEEVKQDRLARFMAHQADISGVRLQLRVGRIEQVIIDEAVEDGVVARSKADAPEIDGQVFIDGATQASHLQQPSPLTRLITRVVYKLNRELLVGWHKKRGMPFICIWL